MQRGVLSSALEGQALSTEATMGGDWHHACLRVLDCRPRIPRGISPLNSRKPVTTWHPEHPDVNLVPFRFASAQLREVVVEVRLLNLFHSPTGLARP